MGAHVFPIYAMLTGNRGLRRYMSFWIRDSTEIRHGTVHGHPHKSSAELPAQGVWACQRFPWQDFTVNLRVVSTKND